MTILYVGFLGRGQQSPLGATPHQLRVLGERCKLLQRGPEQSPGDQQIFLHFGVPRTALLRNMRPLNMREAPPTGGCGGSFLRLCSLCILSIS